MKRKIFNATIILAVALCSLSASAGFDRGNGTDYVRFEDQGAWFATPGRQISYCIEMAPGFGVSQSVAERAVENAFKEWAGYSKKRKFSNGIVFEGVRQPTCTGASDLKFYLGLTNNPELQKHSKNLTDRLAAAIRTSFDLDKVWSQGFVFIAAHGALSASEVDAGGLKNRIFPDWTASDTLNAILLHELGHVFGTEHASDTIMDENLAIAILNYKDHALELSGIDGRRELLETEGPHNGFLGLPYSPASRGYHACRDEVPFNFELLVGRKSIGVVKATFEKTFDNSPYLRTGFLTLQDDAGTFKIAIDFFPGSPLLAGSRSKVFNGVRMVNGHPQGRWAWHSSSAQSFKLTSATGETILGTYEHNLKSAFQYGPTHYELTGEVLTYMTTSGPKILFFSSTAKEVGWSDGPQKDEPENCLIP